jgi:hypothetical protein
MAMPDLTFRQPHPGGRILLSIGAEYEVRKFDGSLAPLSDKAIAKGAIVQGGQIFAPCQTWVKDFPGQVTLGRIGRPAIRYCPLDWHGTKRAARIKRRLAKAGVA